MIINPRNFGASLDSCDNTTALQESLNAVGPGDTWVLDPGEWRFDGRKKPDGSFGLTLPAHLNAVGAGGAVSVLKAMPENPTEQVRALNHKGGKVEMTGIGLVGPSCPRFDGYDKRFNPDTTIRGRYSSTGLYSEGDGEIVLTACDISKFRITVYVNRVGAAEDHNTQCPTKIVGCCITAWEAGVLYRPHGGELEVIGSRICADETTHTGEQPGHALYIGEKRSFTVIGGELVGGDKRPDGANGFEGFEPGWASQHYGRDSGDGVGTYQGVLFTGHRGVLASESGTTVLDGCRFETTQFGLRPGPRTTARDCVFDTVSGGWVLGNKSNQDLIIDGGTWVSREAIRRPLIHLTKSARAEIRNATLIGDRDGGRGGVVKVNHPDATVGITSGFISGTGWFAVSVPKGRCVIHPEVDIVGSATAEGTGVLERL